MRLYARACLISMMIGALLNMPVAGAAEKPLGMVTQSSSARLDSAAAAVGATVYPGDTIDTDSTGSIRLRAGTAQYYLMSASSSRLQQSENGIHAELMRGTAGLPRGSLVDSGETGDRHELPAKCRPVIHVCHLS